MDVAKYIGLFLLKNNFCYIHGLGNLELKRKPASWNGDALVAPAYDVLLSPSGSIDDNLANFIASNEQISISKASNALRDFSTQARADLGAGREVVIPSIGKFYEEEGKIRFSADPHFKHTPAPIPAAKVARTVEQQPIIPGTAHADAGSQGRPYVPVHTPEEEEEEETPSLNWPRIILATIVILSLAAIITFAYKKYAGGEDTLQPVIPTKDNPPVQTVPVAPIPQTADSASVVDSNTTPSPAAEANVPPPPGQMKFMAILESYSNREKAEKRKNQMIAWGKDVQLIIEDTGKYFVVMAITCPVKDTARVLDSLSRLYNPPDKVKMY